MPVAYFERRQDRRRPDPAARSFFRSLRSTPQRDRDRADAQAEHVFDLVSYLEKQVKLPALDIPQLTPVATSRVETERVAEEVRNLWGVPDGPIANVVRLLEAHGVIVVRLDSGGSKLDAFSRWFAERPLVLLWGDKGDKARSRFDAAHELGHLAQMMHDEAAAASAPASLDSVAVSFDDRRSVADAGLILVATPAERLGLAALIDRRVKLGRRPGHFLPHRKVMTLVHAMAAGADSIEDCDLLRSGSSGKVLGHGVLAPSTLGTFLRSFTFGHVRHSTRSWARRFAVPGRRVRAPARAAS